MTPELMELHKVDNIITSNHNVSYFLIKNSFSAHSLLHCRISDQKCLYQTPPTTEIFGPFMAPGVPLNHCSNFMNKKWPQRAKGQNINFCVFTPKLIKAYLGLSFCPTIHFNTVLFFKICKGAANFTLSPKRHLRTPKNCHF